MKLKKCIFLFILLIILCGCTSTYNLEIDGDIFKENIDIVINRDEIPVDNGEGVELDDQITPFLEKDIASFVDTNSKKNYKKSVKYLDDLINVNMKYKYNSNNFNNSSTLNLCFENHKFTTKNSYYIHAFGEFYCLYSEDVDIVIEIKNKVIKSNADYINGNIYTWHIDSKNVNNVNIELETEKGISFSTKILVFSALVVLIIILVFGGIFYKRYKKNNNV